jgi:hypothetical protein
MFSGKSGTAGSNLLRNFSEIKTIMWVCSLVFPFCLSCCAPVQIKEQAFLPYHKKYSVIIPEKEWEVVQINGEDITLRNKQYQATIAFISSGRENGKFSQEVIDRQLFVGLKRKKILLKEPVRVDNQEAIHTVLEFEMDNCKLKIDSYVIQTKDMIFDLVYWAPPDTFQFAYEAFGRIIQSFKFVQGEEIPGG